MRVARTGRSLVPLLVIILILVGAAVGYMIYEKRESEKTYMPPALPTTQRAAPATQTGG